MADSKQITCALYVAMNEDDDRVVETERRRRP
jgi:hypothetical protein